MTKPGSSMEKIIYKKAPWINNTNIYEVNLRQYTSEGTFHAFAKELPRLKEMGVETLWFMPITPISQMKRKGTMGSYYACSDYVSINPEFGNLDDFKNLVSLAHDMGFKILIDWVANHTGWDHVWTKEHPDYYLIDSNTGTFKMASGMDDIIELDHNNPAMRNAIISTMKYWVTECDIDGFRSDLAFWVTLDFWKEARTELEKTKTLFWLAEADVIEQAEYLQVFDAAYAWSWMHKTEDFYKKNIDINVLKDLLKRYDEICGNESITLWFTSNHDENSWNGTEYEKYGDMTALLNVFSFTWNGMPMIYSGQELPNYKRLEFFEKDAIEWTGEYELEDFYRTLLKLKKDNKALRTADRSVKTYLLDAPASVIAFLRRNGTDEVLVLLNFGNENIELELQDEKISGTYINVFTGDEKDFSGTVNAGLSAWGYLLYKNKQNVLL